MAKPHMAPAATGRLTREPCDATRARWSRQLDWMLFAAIALCMLLVLTAFAGKQSFFTDEMHQIGLLESVDSFRALIHLHASTEREVAPPLFAALAWLWYRLVPYGQKWLQLLPILLTCLGVYVMGLAGRAYGGRRMGVLTALLALAAPAVSLTAGMQFRQYCVLFLLSALTTYLYVLRFHACNRERWLHIVLYGVVMAGLPYAHYVSTLLPVAFFLLDVALLLCGRIRSRCLVSYGIGAGLFLPWALAILRSVSARTEFWVDKPHLADLPEMLRFLTDDGGPLFYLFLFGCCVALAIFLRACATRKPLVQENAMPLMLVCVPYFVIGCVFVYSAYLSKNVSLFLPRYFICTIPVILLTAAYGAWRLFDWLSAAHAPRATLTAALALCLFAAISCGLSLAASVHEDASVSEEFFREAADYLSARPDIHDENVAVVTANLGVYVTKGWETYYVTQGGARPSFPIFDYPHPLTDADVAQYDVLYAFAEHASLPAETQSLLDAYYEKDDASIDGEPWRVTRYVRVALPEADVPAA